MLLSAVVCSVTALQIFSILVVLCCLNFIEKYSKTFSPKWYDVTERNTSIKTNVPTQDQKDVHLHKIKAKLCFPERWKSNASLRNDKEKKSEVSIIYLYWIYQRIFKNRDGITHSVSGRKTTQSLLCCLIRKSIFDTLNSYTLTHTQTHTCACNDRCQRVRK